MLHDSLLRDNPPAPAPDGRTPIRPFRLQDHRYDMTHPETTTLVARIRKFVDGHANLCTLGEVSSESGAFARIERITGESGSRLHMAYTLGVMKGDFSARLIREAVELALDTEREGWLCWSFSNHDVARVATRWNPSGVEPEAFAKLCLALLFYLRGTICLYQGEELGLSEAQLTRDQLQDPYGITYWPEFRGRDGSRTPMPWRHDRPNGCFSSSPTPWLPMQEAHRARAIDTQQDDPASCLSVARAMLAWRRRSPALKRGDLEALPVPEPVLLVRRKLGHDATLAAFNTSPETVSVPLDLMPNFTPLEMPGLPSRRQDGQLWLPPYGVALGHTEV
jgi:alpha-glucosidase